MCNRYRPPREPLDERPGELAPGPVFPRWKPSIGPFGQGPFVRDKGTGRELVVGQWALIGDHDKKADNKPRMTNNARWETIATLRTYKGPWARGQRCIVPAESFDYPNWESLKNEWWTLRRADGEVCALAGIWNDWTDPATGELVPSYAMVTQNCDGHSLLARFHKPDEKLPADQQDKRTVVPIELADIDTWLRGSIEEASALIRVPPASLYDAGPSRLMLAPQPTTDGQAPLL